MVGFVFLASLLVALFNTGFAPFGRTN